MSNRRDFLTALAAGGVLLAIGPVSSAAMADAPAAGAAPAPAPAPAPQPPGWVRIAPDGSVTILSNTSELGQGTGTAIAQVLADEMDLD